MFIGEILEAGTIEPLVMPCVEPDENELATTAEDVAGEPVRSG